MEAGQAKEFDKPSNLLKDDNSLFCKLVEATGNATASKVTCMLFLTFKRSPQKDCYWRDGYFFVFGFTKRINL